MFKLHDRNKKQKNKDFQVEMGSEIVINKSVQQMTAKADEIFSKPKYNSQTRRTHYDDGPSHKAVKKDTFSRNDVVRDSYTGAELVQTVKEAKMTYGDDWQTHLAEADHIDPLNQIVKRVENNPWVTTEDIKEIGNRPENLQVVSRRTNQTGGKGGSTQTEWSKDYERMRQISEQTGGSVEAISQRISQIGERAEKRNNDKLIQAGIKNAVNTAHNAGKTTAVNSGCTAATISGIYNVASYIKGEKTAADALIDIGKDSSKSFISGYVNGAGLTVLNHTLASSESELFAALGDNNVAGKVITIVTVAGETVVKWGNGEITTEECLIELGGKGCNFLGSYCGSVVGQTVIPIPVVGGAIGSLVGGVLVSEVYNNIMQEMLYDEEKEHQIQQEIYEAMIRYYAEQQRRAEVQQLIETNTKGAVLCSVQAIIQSGEFQNLIKEANHYFIDRVETQKRIAECVLVNLQLREYRRELQEYFDRYFDEYQECLVPALEFMDLSLKMGNYDDAIVWTNQITKIFGKVPIVENTGEFRKMIFGNDEISL